MIHSMEAQREFSLLERNKREHADVQNPIIWLNSFLEDLLLIISLKLST